MKVKTKRIILLIIMFVSSFVILTVVCNLAIERFAEGRTYDSVQELSSKEYGVLLGTTPMSRYGKVNTFFTNRINAAVELYNAGKIKNLIISGDSCSLNGCNEPVEMRDTLVARGVPAEIIIMDGTGFSTINSAKNVKNMYGVNSCIVISQRFHNERFIYLAHSEDFDAVGYNAKDSELIGTMLVHVREYLARVKVFIDLSRAEN